MTEKEFMAAVALFRLPERATLRDLKERHHELLRRYHPDRGGADDDTIREVNAAYAILSNYCATYRFVFSREEFLEQHPEERLRQQFDWNSVWDGESGEG